MRRLMLPLAALLSGVAMLVLGVGLLFSVLGLRAGRAEFSTVTTGIVMSAYFVGFVIGTRCCPALIGRVGHIRSFAAMASLASTMPILHALWVQPLYWAALRLVTGVCLVGLYIVVESWLNVLAPRELRGKVFALYMTVSCVAMAIGQWLLLVGDRLGAVPFIIVSVLLSFALLPLTLTPVDEPDPVAPPHFGLRLLYRISPLGVAGAFCAGLVSGALFGLGAVFVQRLGHSDTTIAAFMAATILGGAVGQWPVGHLSDRLDRRRVLAAICAGSAVVASLAFALLRFEPIALVPSGIVLGGLLFTIYGVAVAHVNDMIEPEHVLEVTGGLLLVHGVGAAVGPTLAGVLMYALGPGSLLIYLAIVTALLALYTLHRMRFAAPIPPDEKSGFVPLAPNAVHLSDGSPPARAPAKR